MRKRSIATNTGTLPKTREKNDPLEKKRFSIAFFKGDLRGARLQFPETQNCQFLPLVYVSAFSIVFYFVFFSVACLFLNFSFINALILLVSFSFFRLFFVCSTHGIHTE